MQGQFEICYRVLKKFKENKILDKLVLFGSWCGYYYKFYFQDEDYTFQLQTKDMDFAIAIPPKIGVQVDLPSLLESLDFIPDPSISTRDVFLHSEIKLEFFVPLRGSKDKDSYYIKELNIRAGFLRHLDMLLDETITTVVDDLEIRLPNPLVYGLHKLIVSTRRRERGKTQKDTLQGLEMLSYLYKRGFGAEIQRRLYSLSKNKRKAIRKVIRDFEVIEDPVIGLLQ